jgi:hypothetical protein
MISSSEGTKKWRPVNCRFALKTLPTTPRTITWTLHEMGHAFVRVRIRGQDKFNGPSRNFGDQRNPGLVFDARDDRRDLHPLAVERWREKLSGVDCPGLWQRSDAEYCNPVALDNRQESSRLSDALDPQTCAGMEVGVRSLN